MTSLKMDPRGAESVAADPRGAESVEAEPAAAEPAPVEPRCAPLAAEVVDATAAERLARQFAALSDPVRVRLVSLLATAEGGAVCACDLVEPVGKSQPTVSHHLKILTEAGLVAGDKRGRNVWYSVVPGALNALRSVLDA
ncbi:MAG: ArsR/SmtB family transcription factor [Actinomycetes bacterium]